MKTEKLQLNRKFLVIESPIPFEIYCPEQKDGVKRRQGSWQMTIHDLLTKSHYPLNPIYNLELIYDDSLLSENESVVWYTTDLNLGEALRGIDGQLVTLGDEFIDVKVTNFPSSLEVSNFPSSLEVNNLTPVKYNVNDEEFLEKIYTNEINNLTNFMIVNYDFYLKTRDNHRYQFRNGICYHSISSTNSWANETKIIGLQIIDRKLKFFSVNSDTSTEIGLSSVSVFQGFITGFNI